MNTLITLTEDLNEEQKRLALKLADWRNYSYEATMSDYSIESIMRAQRGSADALVALEDAGVDADEVVVWSETHGRWTLA